MDWLVGVVIWHPNIIWLSKSHCGFVSNRTMCVTRGGTSGVETRVICSTVCQTRNWLGVCCIFVCFGVEYCSLQFCSFAVLYAIHVGRFVLKWWQVQVQVQMWLGIPKKWSEKANGHDVATRIVVSG
jgi:hypothetical protein